MKAAKRYKKALPLAVRNHPLYGYLEKNIQEFRVEKFVWMMHHSTPVMPSDANHLANSQLLVMMVKSWLHLNLGISVSDDIQTEEEMIVFLKNNRLIGLLRV